MSTHMFNFINHVFCIGISVQWTFGFVSAITMFVDITIYPHIFRILPLNNFIQISSPAVTQFYSFALETSTVLLLKMFDSSEGLRKCFLIRLRQNIPMFVFTCKLNGGGE